MKKLISLIAGLSLLLSLTACQSRTMVDKLKESETYTPSTFRCGIEDNNFYLDIETLSTTIEESEIQFPLSLSHKDLDSVDNYNDMTYVVYRDKAEVLANSSNSEDIEQSETKEEARLREILISYRIPGEIDLSKLQPDKTNAKVKVGSEHGYASAMRQMEKGQLYTAISGETVKSGDALDFINETYSNITKTNNVEEKDIIIKFDGFEKELHLKDMDALKTAPGMYYGATDNILRLYNYADDKAYAFITTINNPMLMNPVTNLQTTEWNNVYLDKDYDNPERVGYKTFAIMTDVGMYSIRISEFAPENTGKQLIGLLGVNKDDKKIEVPFKIGMEKDRELEKIERELTEQSKEEK